MKTLGFTMIEIVIMMAIITAVSAIVLFKFTALNDSAFLNRSTHELALSIRRAQNMALAITQVDVGGIGTIPPAYGVRLSQAASDADQYIIFGDVINDFIWNAGDDAMIDGIQFFSRSIKVKEITGCAISCPQKINIMFKAPESVMEFHDDSDGTLLSEDTLTIMLTTQAGDLTRKIIVKTSGQVSIK